ncbi:unnamed protein product [Mesocestoides corti]|nr:unnamed protein product [Mesocestoides corti]
MITRVAGGEMPCCQRAGEGNSCCILIGRVPGSQWASTWWSQQVVMRSLLQSPAFKNHFVTMRMPCWIYLLLLSLFSADIVKAIKWLGLHRFPRTKSLEKERFTSNECTLAKYRYGLGRKQLLFCQHPEGGFAMHAIFKSAQAVAYYCPQIFKDRRWNCSSVEHLPRATPDITRTTREKAAMHALASAALMFEIARRCAENKIVDCECGRVGSWDVPPQPHQVEDQGVPDNGQIANTPIQYHWGGCSDNVDVARAYAQAFLGFPIEKTPPRRKSRLAMGTYNPYRRIPRQAPNRNGKESSVKKIRRIVNLHNYKAGFKLIEDAQKIRCKCQGVSGSCAHKICFRQLLRVDSPQLQEMILQRYMAAQHVSVEYGNLLIAKEYDYGAYAPRVIHYGELAFTEHSPDFCEADPRLGSVGTKGR